MLKNKELIYLDHQATTPVAPCVLEGMMPYLTSKFGNPHSSSHTVGWTANAAVESAAGLIAEVFGADSDEVIFTSGATEANNIALQGIAKSALGQSRNRILVASTEHKSVLSQRHYLQEKLGFEVISVPVNAEGYLESVQLDTLLDETVLCLSISSANSEIGTLTDVNALAKRLDNIGAILHCDASQSLMSGQPAPKLNDNMLLSLSAHKIYGPKGVGALLVPGILKESLDPITFGGGQQGGLRPGTIAPFLTVGLAEATKFVTSELASEAIRKMKVLRDQLVIGLLELNHAFSLNGPPLDERHAGNANICFYGHNADDLLLKLSEAIAASTGSACASGLEQTSHVLRAIGLSNEAAAASIRFSLGLETQTEQINRTIELFSDLTAEPE